jgi:hypothetical protein
MTAHIGKQKIISISSIQTVSFLSEISFAIDWHYCECDFALCLLRFSFLWKIGTSLFPCAMQFGHMNGLLNLFDFATALMMFKTEIAGTP